MTARLRDLLLHGALVVLALVLLSACDAAQAGTGPSTSPTSSASSSASPSPTAGPTTSSKSTLSVVGLGDSVMAGTNCGCAGIVTEYADALAQRTGAKVNRADFSDNGLVTDDLDKALGSDKDQQTALRGADVVLVTIGANDLSSALDAWRNGSCGQTCYTSATAEMGKGLSTVLDEIEGLVGAHTQVLVTDYWNVFQDGEMTRRSSGQAQIDFSEDVTDAANKEICAAAKAHSATCVDLLVPFKGTDSHPKDPTPLLASDGDHPNAKGIALIVQTLIQATRAP